MKKLCIIKYGCDGENGVFRQIIKSAEKEYELVKYPDEADVTIHFVCGFTEEDLLSIFQDIVFYEKLKKEGSKLVFCGCGMTAYNPEMFEAVDVVDHVVFGMDIVPPIAEILGVEPLDEQFIEDGEGVLRLKVTESCVKAGKPCYFCKEWYLGNRFESRYSIEKACKLIRYHEKPILIIGGMNTTNYGLDFEEHRPMLHELIREASKIPTVKWIQIEGVASSCIYKELIEEIANNPKVVYVQYFLQSGSQHMLDVMNVGSKVVDNVKVVRRFRENGVAPDGGIIVGHPGETMKDVQETIQFIRDNNLWYVDVIAYQNSKRTQSGKMRQLPKEEYDLHCEMVRRVVQELALDNMKRHAAQGIVGYVKSFYNVEDGIVALVKPLEFEGYVYVPVGDAKAELGDKVMVRNSEVTDIHRHRFSGGSMEVVA